MNEKYKSTIGFIDLLFNILVGFAFLFIVAFILIKPESKKKDFERRAEFVVVMEWDHKASDDIDLYVEDPLRGLVNYQTPKKNFSHLDKDDLGKKNDTTVFHDGTVSTIDINREVVTIRGILPGEWTINGHYFSDKVYDSKFKRSKDQPLTVKVELHRVNPYKILWAGEKKFTKKGQEETFVRFTLDKQGNLVGSFWFRKKTFVKPVRLGSNSSGHPTEPYRRNYYANQEGN